mmetsp:Transcript_19315/g.34441  ORF Transcript_19315/g.34441 Transcript_19315/m.34441 type:complete len:551 (-) Transcript_19315:135-1787(-)
MQDPVGMNSALFHVACPFTGQAQCCCPHGSSFAQAVQQRGLSGNGAKQLFEMWRDRIPQAQSRYSNAHSPVVGSTELMMPRLYRNPKSMEANNDLPVKVGGEMISKNQAAARLAKATVEAKALAGHAAELAAAAGQTFQVPAELEVDTSGLKSPEDLPILKKIASGAIVERAKRGELSDLEEQQLLGLTSDDYCALRGMQVPGAMGQQPPGMTQPAHAQQQPNRTSEDDAPSRDGMNTLRMKEIRASLKGKTLLVKLPQTSTWERALVHVLDLKNRVAKLAFAGASTLIDVDLTQAIRDRVIAWEGDRPEARPSDAGEGQGMPGRSFSGGMGPQPSEPPPQQQQYTPQQLAMMQQYKQQQQQQQPARPTAAEVYQRQQQLAEQRQREQAVAERAERQRQQAEAEQQRAAAAAARRLPEEQIKARLVQAATVQQKAAVEKLKVRRDRAMMARQAAEEALQALAAAQRMVVEVDAALASRQEAIMSGSTATAPDGSPLVDPTTYHPRSFSPAVPHDATRTPMTQMTPHPLHNNMGSGGMGRHGLPGAWPPAL